MSRSELGPAMRRKSVMPTDAKFSGPIEASSLSYTSCDYSANTEGLTSFIAKMKIQKDKEQPPNLPLQEKNADKTTGKLNTLDQTLFA